jgi:hypothetical protein
VPSAFRIQPRRAAKLSIVLIFSRPYESVAF